MNYVKKEKIIVLSLIMLSLLIIMSLHPVLGKIIITNPDQGEYMNSSFYITANISNFNVKNISFYYRTNSSYVLIRTNTTQNLSQYKSYFNITGKFDYYYTFKVNATNGSVVQSNITLNTIIDQKFPNITFINFSNSQLNNRRIFNNNSNRIILISLNETNNTITKVFANSTNIVNSNFTWNNTLKLWKGTLNVLGNILNNNLLITIKDFSNKTLTKTYPFLIDRLNPTITVTLFSDSAYNRTRGIKSNPSLDSKKYIYINITDDINVTHYSAYIDDNLINISNTESVYKYAKQLVTPIVGRHNITIIGKDLFNKTTKNETIVYWWFGITSNPQLNVWENKTRDNSGITSVYFAQRDSIDYFKYNKLGTNSKHVCYSAYCAIVFNYTGSVISEYLEINPSGRNFIEFNFNKTPYMYVNNNTVISRNIISNLENEFSTNIKKIVIINDTYGKTKFIWNDSVYYARTTVLGNFSSLSQFSDILFFENKDNLNEKIIIYQNDTCIDSDTPFTKSSTRPCFVVKNNKTSLYTKKHGIVAFTKDITAPKIDYNYPLGTHNNSINLKLNFSTRESAICSVILKKNNYTIANITQINLTGSVERNNDFFYSFGNKYFSNGIYNISTFCTDKYNNTNTTISTVTISDIVNPLITINSPESREYSTTSSNTYGVSINVNTNELCDIYYRIDSSNTTLIISNSTSAQKNILKATGSYRIYVTARDLAGRTTLKNVSFTVDASIRTAEETTTTNTITTGIGIINQQNTTITDKKSQTWYSLKENIRTDFSLNNPLFDMIKISFTPEKNVSSIKLDVEIIRDKNKYPVKINNESKIIYQYYSITQIAKNYSIKNSEITFRIKKSWLKENNIEKVILSRFNVTWTELDTKKLGEDELYVTYSAITPGFSYFAIVGIPFQPIIEEPKIIIINNSTKINTTKNNTSDISEYVEKNKFDFKSFIIGILISITLMSLAIYAYKTVTIPVLKYSDLTNEEKLKLKNFISIKLSTGEPISKIQAELASNGWTEDIVNKIMTTIEIPKNKERELNEFVEKMMKLKHISKEDLRKSLLKAGWQTEIVENILRKY